MAEYIEREAVLSKCEEIWDDADETTQTGVDAINAIDLVTDFIESLPAADVRKIKHGKWLDSGNFYYKKCSECNAKVQREYSDIANYCPKCGAKMDVVYLDDKIRAIKVV